MTDIHDIATREYNMSKIRGTHTMPELLVRKFLHGKGLRFRFHNTSLLGKLDITLQRFKTVIFVNGCSWHGHENRRYFAVPKTRTKFWLAKIDPNKQRDVNNLSCLKIWVGKFIPYLNVN